MTRKGTLAGRRWDRPQHATPIEAGQVYVCLSQNASLPYITFHVSFTLYPTVLSKFERAVLSMIPNFGTI
jgi:hypothetical protein